MQTTFNLGWNIPLNHSTFIDDMPSRNHEGDGALLVETESKGKMCHQGAIFQTAMQFLLWEAHRPSVTCHNR